VSAAIASLAEDRVVEGVYAVARKERRRTKAGSPYLALELVDPSGRIEARVWSDVELLDNRFSEGDAVHVLGRVERFRDRLQLDVRSLEAAEADPAGLAPAMRRDAATVGVATLCREAAQLHPRLRVDLLLAAALLHDVGRTRELERGPTFRQTEEGRLLGHVHLGLRLIEERANSLASDARAELLHAVATHHDARAARTAEASVLYHANQLDATAATRPVD
jgi:3'-5' exoribonuclease